MASEAQQKIERALDAVSELCAGKRRWTMSIPARPDDDPDLVISGALTDAAAEIARLSRELEEARERERGLPRTADGVPIVPGMEVWREYLGDRWEAKVVAVHAAAIDIQYTNAANHAAQYHVARGADPTDWHFLSTPQEAGGAD